MTNVKKVMPSDIPVQKVKERKINSEELFTESMQRASEEK